MNNPRVEAGLDELRAARRESRTLFWAVGIFSFMVNLLMLTGPLYMLQVYDRVLGSRSYETLIGLTAIVAFLYGMMGLLDYARARVMARVGSRFQARLDRRVFDAVVRKSAIAPDDSSATGLRDLESIQRLLISPALMALFDMPWTPFFLAGIMLFHPWLGFLAIGGGVILILMAVLNQTSTRLPIAKANMAVVQSEKISGQMINEAEMVQAMGMREASFQRWQESRNGALSQSLAASDAGGMYSTLTKTFRLFLQSAMLGLGAYLVLQGELSPGAMIAGSILMGRALAPIEQTISQWPMFQRASKGWDNLALLLGTVAVEQPKTTLPAPKAKLEAQQLTVVPPGQSQATLRMINFALEPGQAMGVIGTSGAGKSTLARALTGLWRPAGGKIRLDGAALDQYEPNVLGQLIGYLPQRVELFDGTIAENIARLDPDPDAAKVVAAAKKADAHDMIVKMPEGYDTRVASSGGRLSGGQIQRIGLARAMYSDPVILVLDEPNSNLDNEGSQALNTAIRAMKAEGKSVLIMAHRPAAIQECDLILMLEGGNARAFGPKEEVLKKMVQNHKSIARDGNGGGVK
ncbi:type I secretion system permease/ATPase [Thalassovita sp.]|uniref:type I secretion system permease/ATPase n=1 Tax=Thalassovita sp. TaxID=1979401 RepID=UPI0028814527|nr:type I secretion system permease/ATPase [Thalassovita sp.]MDF1802287.1 type I secretion system permease/ATPase [Thalassovita sp.]